VELQMNWQEEHRIRIAAFPDDVRKAHEHCSNHRDELIAGAKCGCFYCCAIFDVSEIADWVDEDDRGIGQTALCPRCGIDSVIGEKSGYDVSINFLERMRALWF
jgi:hypothetical protein